MLPLGKLPLETRSRLRSGQILTTLAQLISELIQNSLDANASHIEVGVDCEEWECWVRDDGSGISKSGLATLSSEAGQKRYSMLFESVAWLGWFPLIDSIVSTFIQVSTGLYQPLALHTNYPS